MVCPQIPIQKLKPQRPMPTPQRPAVGATRGLPVSSPPEAQQPTRKKLKSAAGQPLRRCCWHPCILLSLVTGHCHECHWSPWHCDISSSSLHCSLVAVPLSQQL